MFDHCYGEMVSYQCFISVLELFVPREENYLWLDNNRQYLCMSLQYVAFTLGDAYVLEVPQELSRTTVSQKRKAGI